MDVFTAIIVYLMIWWTLLFMVLPWGNRGAAEQQVQGEIISAPVRPNLRKKFIITSILSLVILGIIATLIELNVVDFKALSTALMEESISQ